MWAQLLTAMDSINEYCLELHGHSTHCHLHICVWYSLEKKILTLESLHWGPQYLGYHVWDCISWFCRQTWWKSVRVRHSPIDPNQKSLDLINIAISVKKCLNQVIYRQVYTNLNQPRLQIIINYYIITANSNKVLRLTLMVASCWLPVVISSIQRKHFGRDGRSLTWHEVYCFKS